MPDQLSDHCKSQILDDVETEKGFRLTFFCWKDCTVVRIDSFTFPSSTSGWYKELGQYLSSTSLQVPARLFREIPSDVQQQLMDTGILKNCRYYNIDSFLEEYKIQAQRKYNRFLIPGKEGSGHVYEIS